MNFADLSDNLFDVLATYLHNSLDVVHYAPGDSSGNIFDGRLPAEPDAAIALYVTGGPGTDPYRQFLTWTMQVMTRGAVEDARGPRRLAFDVYNALHEYGTKPMGQLSMVNIKAVAAPSAIGPDQNRRFRYSTNYQLEISLQGVTQQWQ